MSTYPTGTVASATVRGVEGVRVMWRDAGYGWLAGWFVASGHAYAPERDVTDIRPLVVLDVDAIGRTPERLAEWLRKLGHYYEDHEGRNRTSRALATLADQIEAQTKPPRIPEPGLYGVVKASLNGKATGETDWVHLTSGWYRGADDESRPWSELQNPTLIREGLS